MSPVRFLKGQFEVWSLGLPFTAISVHNWRREILICEKVWSWSWRILNILLIQWWFWKSNKKLTFEAVKLSTERWCWAMDAFRSWGFPFPLKDFLEPIYFPWPFKGRSLSHLWSSSEGSKLILTDHKALVRPESITANGKSLHFKLIQRALQFCLSFARSPTLMAARYPARCWPSGANWGQCLDKNRLTCRQEKLGI